MLGSKSSTASDLPGTRLGTIDEEDLYFDVKLDYTIT